MSWPTGTPIYHLSASTLALENGFDLYSGFLGDGRALFLGLDADPVLTRANLADAQRVELIDMAALAGPNSRVEAIAPLTDDAFAAVLGSAGRRITTVWRIR
ncbi:MAG: hypothetical protein ACK5LS_04390 [Propioniciclava sp.]